MSSVAPTLGTFNPNEYKGNQASSGKPKQRMAGDYLNDFANLNANDKKDANEAISYQGNNGRNYGTNTERMLFGNSAPKDTNVDNTSNKAPVAASQQAQASSNSTPKTVPTAAPQQSPVTYDEDKYRYYDSEFGSGTGAAAYAKDMENYNEYAANYAGNPHMGLVTQMMHPDWGRSQRAGGGAEDPTGQDYATRPTFEAGSKAAVRFDRKFGEGSSSGPRSKY